MTATNTAVIEAWLKTLEPVTDASKVGPTLPSATAGWASTGFWQVTTVGGSPHPDLGTARPVTEVSCWAATPNSEFAPHNRAEQMAMDVRNAAARPVTTRTELTVNGEEVVLLGVSVVSEPRRVPEPRTGYARSMVQLAAHWGVEG